MPKHKDKKGVLRKPCTVTIEAAVWEDFHSIRVAMGHKFTDMVDSMVRKYIADYGAEAKEMLEKQRLLEDLNGLTVEEIAKVVASLKGDKK